MGTALAARAWRWLTGEDWCFEPASAAVRIVAVVGVIAAGIAHGKPIAGIIAAAGAFSVGFGAPYELRGSRLRVYLTTTVGIGVGAVVGSLAAERLASAMLAAAAAGVLLGVAASYGASIGWIALQGGIAVMIAMSYPATLEGALHRAALVVGGALAQTAVLAAAQSVRHRPAGPAPVTGFVPHYAAHLVVALASGVALERLLALRNGYWVPMTTLLVLRPASQHTMTRALARTVGTLAGCAVASLVALLHPPMPVIVGLVACSAFGAYAFQQASYGLLATCITSYVVFLLMLAGMPEKTLAVARLTATALGAGIAFAVHGASALFARVRFGHGRRASS